MLCLTFPENSFHFVAQKLKKKHEKWHFQRFRTFPFDLKVASKPSNLKNFDYLLHFPHLPHLVAEIFAKM